MIGTKQKILDSAEGLIARQGYAATSLRQIIAEAGVNLASVHYHFGSKEELLDELVKRKAGPVNDERLKMLDACEAAAGRGPLPVEKVLEAFLAPPFRVRASNPQFVCLMGRMYGEGLMPGLVKKHFEPLVTRFMAALRRSLPGLPPQEIAWRVQFMVGAMAHTMFAGAEDGSDVELLIRRMVTFCGAGFRSQVEEK